MAAPLKDQINRAVAVELGERFASVEPAFDVARFVARVWPALDDLELKPRISLIASELHAELDRPYCAALDLVVEVARSEPHLAGFGPWALCTFVEQFGVDDPHTSLPAMEHLTKRASCEFAVRPFLLSHWEATIETLRRFADDDDPAVRRLASEGTRPRLPWAMGVPRLTEEPEAGLALVEHLRHDADEVVRRSVANHLNDCSRAHPELVIGALQRWVAESPPVDDRMARHALRTLVKQGHPAAMELLGFASQAEVDVESFTVEPEGLRVGAAIELEARVRSIGAATQRLVVDFVVHHVTARGATSPKVFKWTSVTLEPGQAVTISKRRSIAHASTRTYHAGHHRVDLQIAGAVVASSGFDLEV